MRARGNEIDVSLHGKARGGKDAFAIQRSFARKASGLHQAQPFFDAARFSAVAVVIKDALAPRQTEGGILGASQNCSVFYGNAALIVVAIERPGLQLAAGELAFMHQEMKWVLVVIALFAYGVKAGDELGLGEQGPIGLGGDD